MQQARETGARVVLTHLQTFNAIHLESAEALLLAMAEAIAEQLDLEVLPAEVWDSRRGPSPGFRQYLRREVLGKLPVPLVWGLDEVARYYGVVGGHPYLVRRGLHERVMHNTRLTVFEARSSSDDWIFGDHLRRIRVLLAKDNLLSDTVSSMLRGQPCPHRESFFRLRSEGVLTGDSPQEARFRCPLYAAYLEEHLL